MNPAVVYAWWAPEGAAWSPWVKPVLFAHVDSVMPATIFGAVAAPESPPAWDVFWAPPADGSSAIVVDAPGDTGVGIGLALASVGYRPVPLYNAAPPPGGGVPVVDVAPIVRALAAGADVLESLDLPPDAPPAFLLDASRRVGSGTVAPAPGRFDNRSVSLPTDFPSGNLMAARGIRRAILAQSRGGEPQADLAHALLRWQEAGARIESLSLLEAGARPAPIAVRRPSAYRLFWQRLLAAAGLIRHPLGGFGGFLPVPSSSSGGRGWVG